MYRVSRENPGQFQIIDTFDVKDSEDKKIGIEEASVTITPIFGSAPGLITLAAETLEGFAISLGSTSSEET